MNQCDGCTRELLLADGIHYERAGYDRSFGASSTILRLRPVQACQADKYTDEWDAKFRTDTPDEATF